MQLQLGDNRVCYGLWRAIEHMRKGEKSRIMVKPSYGYGMSQYLATCEFPAGYTTGKAARDLMTRRVFFEVTLYDWVIRHDLHGNGMILKTISIKGLGYDRPGHFDEMCLDLKVYQGDKVWTDIQGQEMLMDTPKIITPVVR